MALDKFCIVIPPEDHPKERERIESLKSYSILDSLPETDYDNLTKIASEICGTPISLISLIDKDRQWFKSNHGIDAKETPREQAFCAHAIHDQDNILVVQDARKDERFQDNPLVTGDAQVIFYAGVPLVGEEGLPLGTLCVIDNKPNLLSKSQVQSLKALSRQVMNLMALRRNKERLEQSLESLEEKNEELERFASIAAHDLKTPLGNITGLAQLILDEYASKMDTEGRKMLELILESTSNLSDLIKGLLVHSRSENFATEEKTTLHLSDLQKRLAGLFTYENRLELSFESSLKTIRVNETALLQILINLVSNAVKYNDRETAVIEVGVTETTLNYTFTVKDNGPGIREKDQDRIFNIFETAANQDRFNQSGHGIGLATVKKIVQTLGGSIEVKSSRGEGATFSFTIGKK